MQEKGAVYWRGGGKGRGRSRGRCIGGGQKRRGVVNERSGRGGGEGRGDKMRGMVKWEGLDGGFGQEDLQQL